jgi:hypothetical protein
MKNCPVCKLDYADDFSFCEFDGALLDKVIQEKQQFALFSALKSQQRTLRLIAFGLAIGLVSLYIFAKAIPNRKTPVMRQQEIAALDASPYFQTPQAAQNYVEENSAGDSVDADAENEGRKKHNNDPEKPGVTVTLPEAKTTKNPQPSTQSKPVEEADAASQTVTPAPPQKPKRVESLPSAINQPTAQTDHPYARPQVGKTRANESDELPSTSPNTSGSVNLSLVRLRSFRTETGIRYDLTLNMQQQEGRVIRWERINLATHSQSGITHTEILPFSQRLGSSGSLSFTVSVEMRGRNESDWQGRISCTGVGTDVEGRNVKTNFTARVNP